MKTGCARPLLETKNSDPHFVLFFFGCFLSEITSRRCRLSRTTSDPAKTSGKFQPKITFFLFFRRKNWHDLITLFSTLTNIKGFLPTNSTTPNRLQCRVRPSDEEFHGCGPTIFSNIAKKKFFFSRPAFSCDPHPKRSP